MNGKLSLRDYEALSAYLDGALDVRSQTHLEKRLQVEENLKQELEALKRNRIILRSQPRMRAPRNFTLTPQMAGVRQQARYSMGAFSALRLASVLATIFLVLVMAGDFVGSSMKPQTIVASDLPQQAPWAMPGFGMGGGGGGGSDVGSEPVMPAEDAAMEMPAVESTDTAAMKAMPEAGAPEAETALQAVPPASLAEESAVSEAPPSAVEPEISANAASREVAEEATGQTSWTFIKILQVLLALLAISTGLGALLLWRTSRN